MSTEKVPETPLTTKMTATAMAADTASIVSSLSRPLRAVTPEEIHTFWRDGVVKLEQVLPSPAIRLLAEAFDDIFQRPKDLAGTRQELIWDFSPMARKLEARGQASNLLADGGYHVGTCEIQGQFLSEANCGRWHTDFRDWAVSGPLPELISQLLGSQRLQFHNDQLFLKEPRSLLRTAFHQDASFFLMKGHQMAICWVPLDPVERESGAMGYVRGSHRWPDAKGRPGVVFQPKNLVTKEKTQPALIGSPQMTGRAPFCSSPVWGGCLSSPYSEILKGGRKP